MVARRDKAVRVGCHFDLFDSSILIRPTRTTSTSSQRKGMFEVRKIRSIFSVTVVIIYDLPSIDRQLSFTRENENHEMMTVVMGEIECIAYCDAYTYVSFLLFDVREDVVLRASDRLTVLECELMMFLVVCLSYVHNSKRNHRHLVYQSK
jgi:hypothetical protein